MHVWIWKYYLRKRFCEHEIYYCHCIISGYPTNRFLSVSIMHEYRLCSRSHIREKSFVSVTFKYILYMSALMLKYISCFQCLIHMLSILSLLEFYWDCLHVFYPERRLVQLLYFKCLVFFVWWYYLIVKGYLWTTRASRWAWSPRCTRHQRAERRTWWSRTVWTASMSCEHRAQQNHVILPNKFCSSLYS